MLLLAPAQFPVDFPGAALFLGHRFQFGAEGCAQSALGVPDPAAYRGADEDQRDDDRDEYGHDALRFEGSPYAPGRGH